MSKMNKFQLSFSKKPSNSNSNPSKISHLCSYVSPIPSPFIKNHLLVNPGCPTKPQTCSFARSSFLPCVNLQGKNPKRQNTYLRFDRIQHIQANGSRDGDSNAQEELLNGQNGEPDEWVSALEGLFLEALKTYYQGTPMFSDSEFNTLRDELEHLGLAQIRLGAMEKIWVQATSARDFDRRVREEFEMSEDEFTNLKNKLLKNGSVKRPTATMERTSPTQRNANDRPLLPQRDNFLKDAQKIEAGERVDERIKWLLFSDASEERLKILLLYLPAVLMSFVTASVFTILFALLDGEMQITVTPAGRFRLGILSYVVVMLTMCFSNQVTPVMLDYLDLGQPTLMRGDCPICGAPVSCLFTGAARTRDERKCGVCGSMVGFNRKWSKVYLVAPPGSSHRQDPD